MSGLTRREPHGEAADVFSRFDRMFDEWARMMPFRPMLFPRWREAEELIRVEEFREDGALVIRADLPGIDPDKDVELTVSDGMLHIEAERREEEKREEKGYVRQELRYGSLSRCRPERRRPGRRAASSSACRRPGGRVGRRPAAARGPAPERRMGVLAHGTDVCRGSAGDPGRCPACAVPRARPG